MVESFGRKMCHEEFQGVPLCNVLFKLTYKSFEESKYIKFGLFLRLLRSDVCCSGGCANGQKLASKLLRHY